jgi:hypothetical protein
VFHLPLKVEEFIPKRYGMEMEPEKFSKYTEIKEELSDIYVGSFYSQAIQDFFVGKKKWAFSDLTFAFPVNDVNIFNHNGK